MTMDTEALIETRARARQALLDARAPGGWWEGELSSSALSTATAVFAIHLLLEHATRLPAELERDIFDESTEKTCRRIVRDGLAWLALHQNRDGGWGDTVHSLSNISTTVLCWAALAADANTPAAAYASVTSAAENWIAQQAGGCDPIHLVPAIIARYGKDKTFSVPILTMCALAGRLGEGPSAWRQVPQLPFELAAFPQRGFKWMKLPVVSYALPALIAIGQVRYAKRPGWNPLTRAIRAAARRRTLNLLRRLQPQTGGFLEATPLTSFVVMSLIGAGQAAHPVVRHGINFLIRSARVDGSWPIDTNLATWVTTLSVNALANSPDFSEILPEKDRRKIYDWLMAQHYRQEHPYTLADAGGWAWTPLAGGVPDADDTAGALLALKNLGIFNDRTSEAATAGVRWLLNLQNRDGGIPTFCRGWGTLPFDRGSADLTAHALRAWAAWYPKMPAALQRRMTLAAERAVDYLVRTQQADGSWLPLWFGNQHAPDDINPTYGTARVILSSRDVRWAVATNAKCLCAGINWLLSAQRPDGGWGAGKDTPASIEETALAVEALAHCLNGSFASANQDRVRSALGQGIAWLAAKTERGRRFEPTPIGFYFAKLWYFETLYPLVFTVAALEAARIETGIAST